MGLSRSAVEGQDGIEDVAELDACGRYDIGGAGSEAHHPGVAVDAKEVVVVGNDSAIEVVENLRPGGGSVACDQRADQSEGAVAVVTSRRRRCSTAELPEMVLLVTVRVPTVPHTAASR